MSSRSDLRSSRSSSAAEAGALAQAGDVGPAAWRRHDALGVPTRNVVVDLGAWKNKRKISYSC